MATPEPSDARNDIGTDANADAKADASNCITQLSSTIPGVRIEFPSQRCNFSLAEAAAGITFHYRVVVEQAISDLEIPNTPCSCEGPLRVDVSDGRGQWYCECDFGCCDMGKNVVYPLVPATTEGTLSWNGLNWNGPSDTGQPYWPSFPPGNYGFEVTLGLIRNGDARPTYLSATGTLSVTLVP